VTLLRGSFTSRQKDSESELQVREVLHKQQIEGDLNGAILESGNDIRTIQLLLATAAVRQPRIIFG